MFKFFVFILLVNFVDVIISYEECGRSSLGTAFSVGGEYSEVGQWPWLAPLFNKKTGNFFCGSNILSNRILLTAAHCIQKKNAVNKLAPNSIYAYPGRYQLNATNENFAKVAEIVQVYVHPDWSYSATSYDGDIAILKTVSAITFSTHIKPVCLPSNDAAIFNVNGYVAGYGMSEENGHHETKPKHIQIRTVTQEVCLFSDPIFVRISSPRMFCAGEKGKNPCKGDSGSGYFVKSGNSFQVIGIVSAAPSSDCAENDYAILTSVPKFLDWIEQFVEDEQSKCKRNVRCRIEQNEEGPQCHINLDLLNQPRCKLIFDTDVDLSMDMINLIGSKMDFVPDVTSGIAKFKNIKRFDAGWVEIKEISRKDMSQFKDFRWVSFWENKLENVPSNAFADLTKLDKLILSKNKLRTLDSDTFSTNVKLRELWLQDNQLETLPRGLFRNNPELSIIYAEGNKLRSIKVDFTALPKFHIITLMNNECISAWCEAPEYCGNGSKEAMQRKILLDC